MGPKSVKDWRLDGRRIAEAAKVGCREGLRSVDDLYISMEAWFRESYSRYISKHGEPSADYRMFARQHWEAGWCEVLPETIR